MKDGSSVCPYKYLDECMSVSIAVFTNGLDIKHFGHLSKRQLTMPQRQVTVSYYLPAHNVCNINYFPSPLPPILQRPCVVLVTFEHFQLFYLLCFHNYFTMHFNVGFIVLCFLCPSTLVIRICIFLSYRITNLYLCSVHHV